MNYPLQFTRQCDNFVRESELRKYSNLGTRFQNNFSFARKFFNKIFLTQEENDCFTISAKMRKFLGNSILLIMILCKMEGLANINMSKDSYKV